MARHEYLPICKAALEFKRFAGRRHAGEPVGSVAENTGPLAAACFDALKPGHRLRIVYTSAKIRSLGVPALKDSP